MIVTVGVFGRNCWSKTKHAMASVNLQMLPEPHLLRSFYADDASDKDMPPEFYHSPYKQPHRLGGLGNMVTSLHKHADISGAPDIVVIMGADDLMLPGCIKRIIEAHEAGAWVTYGNYRTTSGQPSRCKDYSKDFRNEQFVAMPPLSFRWELFKKVREQDLKMNGYWQPSSGDVAYMLPMMEMAGLERVKFIEDVIYEYTIHEGNDGARDKYLQDFCYWYSRNRHRYSRIATLEDQPVILENEPTTSIGVMFVPRSASWPASKGAIEMNGLKVEDGKLKLPIPEEKSNAQVLRQGDSVRVDDDPRPEQQGSSVVAGVDQGLGPLQGVGRPVPDGGAHGIGGISSAAEARPADDQDPQRGGAAGSPGEALVPEQGRYSHLNGMKLMLGLPIYSSPETQFMFSLLKLVMALKTVGVDITMCNAQDSLITRGRNRIGNAFLESDCTDLLFLDADLHFEPEAALELLNTPHEFIGCVYPMKSVDFDAVIKAHKAGLDNYVKAASTYVINWKIDKDTLERVDERTARASVSVKEGCALVHDVGTGFLRLKRTVFEKLAPHVEDYLDDMVGTKGKKLYDFFNTFIEPETKRFLSEDYALCRRWQRIGGEVYAFVDAELGHIGKFTHQGDVRAILTPKE